MNPLAIVDRLAGRILQGLNALFGFQWSPNEKPYIFEVLIPFADAAAIGTSATGTIRITQDADFVGTKLVATCRVDDTGQMVACESLTGALVANSSISFPDLPALLLMTDGSSDQQMMNEPVDLFGAAGFAGGAPSMFAKPRLFPRNTTITCTLSVLKAAAANTGFDFRLQIHGWKIQDAAAMDLTTAR